jgi:large subunit ribosomal protein L24
MARKIRFRDQNKPKEQVKIRLKKDDTVGVSMVKRHTRPNPSRQIKGGIAERETSISVSNVMVVTSGGVATRIGYRMETTGNVARRVRIAKKGGEILDKKA